jgi:hypothetical protein
MLEQLAELEDRYEKELEFNFSQMLVSFDKNEISEVAKSILKHVLENLETTISSALKYIEEKKILRNRN